MQASGRLRRLLASLSLMWCVSTAAVGAYDPLDPTGNVTIVWDIIKVTSKTTYTVNVTIQNLQLFQTVSNWSLTWSWRGKEYIGGARGAEATEQGDCKSLILNNNTEPHCCLPQPTIVDLALTEPPPFPGCCRYGYLNNLLQRPKPTVSAFQLDVANVNISTGIPPPRDLAFASSDYSCTQPFQVPTLNHTEPPSVRKVPSFETWNAVCTYRKQEIRPPKCCVSFSAFYSPQVIPCADCACACGSFSRTAPVCLQGGVQGAQVTYLTEARDIQQPWEQTNSIVCSKDGCPIHIRYHVKDNYEGYWRGKITVFNREFQKNYTEWQLVMQQPNVGNMVEVFSFNSTFVQPYGVNNTVAFFGREFYNEWLVSASNVTGPGIINSEMLFKKNDDFSLAEGWAFPRKVLFMGSECSLPKDFPSLPTDKPWQL